MIFPRLIGKSIGYVRKVVVFVVGGTVLLIGIAMIVLPGPAVVVIPIGLGILAVEFAWARTLLNKARGYIARGVDAARSRKNRSK